MLYITEITEAQVVYFVRKIKFVASMVQLLDHRRIVMATYMEITRDFVDVNEARELATLFII